jgi:hypothetical protein
MATVTGYTAERMKQIEDKAITDGEVRGDDLILIAHDLSEIDAGNVRGPQGTQGPMGEISQAELDAAISSVYNIAVPRFANAAARDAAIPAPVKGQLCMVGAAQEIYISPLGWLKVGAQPRFHLELSANVPQNNDALNPPIIWDVWDDVHNMVNHSTGRATMPLDGIVVTNWAVGVNNASGAANPYAGSILASTVNTMLRSGSRFQYAQQTQFFIYTSIGMAILPVTAGQTLMIQPYITAVGSVKTLLRTADSGTCWDLMYLSFT